VRAPSDTQLVSTRHGPMLVFRGDVYVGRSLDLYGEYCAAEFDIFAQIIRPGMTVVEVGANIGAHTVPLARRCAPGPLWAFEPQQRVFQLLCANLALGQVSNAICLPEACGAAPGFAEVPAVDYSGPENIGGVSLGPASERAAPALTVRVTPLDELRLPACEFLKIDVEGWETEVLQGAAGTIARFAPTIYVENDRAAKQEAVIRTLDGMGYQSFWHLAPLYSPENFNRTTENVFGGSLSLNMLSVPKARAGMITGLEPVDPDNWRSPVAAL